MTREQLNELNALVAENDALTLALANIESGGVLINAGVSPTADYVAPMMIMPPPPMMAGMPAMSASVPIRGDVPAALMTELTNYLMSRKSAVEADLASRGATADSAPQSAPQRAAPARPAPPPLQRPAPPQR